MRKISPFLVLSQLLTVLASIRKSRVVCFPGLSDLTVKRSRRVILEGGWDACRWQVKQINIRTWGNITQQRELFRVHIDHNSLDFRGSCFFVASRGWWGWLSGLSELEKELVFNIYYKHPHKYITCKHIPPIHASSLFLFLSPSITSVPFLSHLIHTLYSFMYVFV